MRCSAARKLIYSHVDGALKPELQTLFDKHVEQCPDCARELRQAHADHVALTGQVTREPAQPEFVAGVMARVRAAEAWKTPDYYRVVLSRRTAHFAAIGVAAVAALFLVARALQRRSPESAVRTAERSPAAPGPVSVVVPQPFASKRKPEPPLAEHPGGPKKSSVRPVIRAPKPFPRTRREAGRQRRLPVIAWVLSQSRGLSVRAGSPGAPWIALSRRRPIRLGELLRTGNVLAKVATTQGHHFWLNRATVVQFRGRVVALFCGEVFVIAKHSSHGLIIRTPGTATTVHGTRFNVELLRAAVRVTVVEGKVEVGTSGGACLLRACQQATASPGTAPSQPQVVDVQSVIAWTGMRIQASKPGRPEVIQAKPSQPAPPPELAGVTFTAKPEPEAGVFAGVDALLTFVVTVDYAEAAPRNLKLIVTVKDGDGKVAVEREETIADEQHRYRVKKVLLDRLPPGDYVGRFTLMATGKEAVREVKFVVR